MQSLSARKKLSIIGQYFSGLSYDEISSKSGVSKGTVANVISELKAGGFPEAAGLGDQLELLRELSVDLKRSKLSPGQCATGLLALDRIKECGLTPGDIDRLPLILKSAGSEAEAQEFVDLVYSICEVMEREGLSIDGLNSKVRALEKKASELEPIAKKRDDCRREITELEEQRDELAAAVTSLKEKYDVLNPCVKDLDKRRQELLRCNKEMEAEAQKAEATLAALKEQKQRLVEIGLSLDELAGLSQTAQSIARHYNITSAELRSRLLKELKNLDKALGMEVLVGQLKVELKEQKRATALAQQEADGLTADIGSRRQEKARLDAAIKHTREEMANEIAKIVPSIRDAISQVQKELKAGHDEALIEVRRLRDEIIAVGIEIGRYEQMMQSNKWLSDLLALVQGDEAVEAKQVKVILLPVLRGAALCLERKKGKDFKLTWSLTAISNLIKEIEKWEA